MICSLDWKDNRKPKISFKNLLTVVLELRCILCSYFFFFGCKGCSCFVIKVLTGIETFRIRIKL